MKPITDHCGILKNALARSLRTYAILQGCGTKLSTKPLPQPPRARSHVRRANTSVLGPVAHGQDDHEDGLDFGTQRPQVTWVDGRDQLGEMGEPSDTTDVSIVVEVVITCLPVKTTSTASNGRTEMCNTLKHGEILPSHLYICCSKHSFHRCSGQARLSCSPTGQSVEELTEGTCSLCCRSLCCHVFAGPVDNMLS